MLAIPANHRLWLAKPYMFVCAFVTILETRAYSAERSQSVRLVSTLLSSIAYADGTNRRTAIKTKEKRRAALARREAKETKAYAETLASALGEDQVPSRKMFLLYCWKTSLHPELRSSRGLVDRRNGYILVQVHNAWASVSIHILRAHGSIWLGWPLHNSLSPSRCLELIDRPECNGQPSQLESWFCTTSVEIYVLIRCVRAHTHTRWDEEQSTKNSNKSKAISYLEPDFLPRLTPKFWHML